MIAILTPGGDYDANPEVGSAPSLTPFIDTANVVVTRVAACALRKGITLSAAELELIERWLAALYYCQSDKPYASRSTAGASGSFHGQTGMYLTSTLYGQTALNIDSSGCLDAIANGPRKTATASWLGKAPSEQTDYMDRD